MTGLSSSALKTLLPGIFETDVTAWLKEQGLSERRIQHSLGTARVAGELAQLFQLKPEQVAACQTAGLLHDCAKSLPLNKLLTFCRDADVLIDDADRKSPAVLHAVAGPALVQSRWESLSESPEVLNAIRWHTTGRTNMGLVEEIVYIADKIEPTLRSSDFSAQVRTLLDARRLNSLDDAVLFLLNHSLRVLLDQCQPIHPLSLEARNHYLQRAQRCVTFTPELLVAATTSSGDAS